MTILISQAEIIDSRHPANGKKRDILIRNGKIVKIAAKISDDADELIKEKGLCVSIGWMDFRANFRDPGAEQKEDIASGIDAAKRGGFTAVALMPSTLPAVDNKGAVEYIINRSKNKGIEIIPVGAVSKGLNGESLAEMYDMFQAGAKAFTDDRHSIAESGLLQRALLYTRNFGASILHFPYDAGLVPNGQMHEGIISTELGLKGIPDIAEEMVVQRDLSLLAYTEGRLHLGPLSTVASLKLIETARKSGLHISSEVAAANLIYADHDLTEYDSNYKLMPPLRSEGERKKLVDALKKGWIDVISSDHSPEDEEHKKLEFDFAAFGMAAIEGFFPLLFTKIGMDVSLDRLVGSFSINPRKVLGLEILKSQKAAVPISPCSAPRYLLHLLEPT